MKHKVIKVVHNKSLQLLDIFNPKAIWNICSYYNIQHAIRSLLRSNFISLCFFLSIFVTPFRRHCCERRYILSHASFKSWMEDVTQSISIAPDCANSDICWWAGEKAAVIIPWFCDLPSRGRMLQRDSSSTVGSMNFLSPWTPWNYKSTMSGFI